MIGGALAAIGGGALLAIALSGPPGPAANVDSSSSPSVTASGSGSGTSSASPSLEATASPTRATAEIIANRAIAAVSLPQGSILRASGTTSAVALAELEEGRQLFVIGEPTEADDLRWYRVAVISGRDEDCADACGAIGWVATPTAANEKAWVEPAGVDCPSSPIPPGALDGVDRLVLLSCYGRSQIVLEGTVDAPCCSFAGPFEYVPEWLASPVTPVFIVDLFGFRASPDADLDPPQRGDVVRVTGHFEDPAATDCRVAFSDEHFEGDGFVLPNQARTVLDCRATFVWEDYVVTGHEDLGPCCGSVPGSTGMLPARRIGAV